MLCQKRFITSHLSLSAGTFQLTDALNVNLLHTTLGECSTRHLERIAYLNDFNVEASTLVSARTSSF